jgi:hypothetical protein
MKTAALLLLRFAVWPILVMAGLIVGVWWFVYFYRMCNRMLDEEIDSQEGQDKIYRGVMKADLEDYK